MKKIQLMRISINVFMLLLIYSFSFGQAGVDWQLVGNAATITDFLGTTNAIPLKIHAGMVLHFL